MTPIAERSLDPLQHRSGRVWHCRVPAADVPGAAFYAYRVDGPRDPRSGGRFTPTRSSSIRTPAGLFFPPAFSRRAAIGPGANDGRAPLGVLPQSAAPFDWQGDERPRHTHDLVIYEMHVSGFTARANSGVPADRRGTFAGVVEKIPYLKELGVTVVELLPVHQFDPQEGNYWGYMTLHFFAPHQQYARRREALSTSSATMVQALHAAGHRGVARRRLQPHHRSRRRRADLQLPGHRQRQLLPAHARSAAATSTTPAAATSCAPAHPAVRVLVLESLRFWAGTMGVDGFRFDLASIFSRAADGTIEHRRTAALAEICLLARLFNVRLVAEAWDIGSYQLGRASPASPGCSGTASFATTCARSCGATPGKVGALMQRLYGSDDLFPDGLHDDAYRPHQSVNFLTAHDGFSSTTWSPTTASTTRPTATATRDGTDDNLSWNCGWEGDEDAPEEVLALRRRQAKNFCALLLLANGIPMIVAGDEFLNTQRGNNNPYNQDNETTWLDWDRARRRTATSSASSAMIAFRKARPVHRARPFWRDDVSWYGVNGGADMSPSSHTLAFCLHGASERDDDLYVLINAYWQPLEFTIQEGAPGSWRRAVDTSLSSPDDIAAVGSEPIVGGLQYTAGPRSVVVLVR